MCECGECGLNVYVCSLFIRCELAVLDFAVNLQKMPPQPAPPESVAIYRQRRSGKRTLLPDRVVMMGCAPGCGDADG